MIETKVCVVGAFATGKTSLVARFLGGRYTQRYETTVGVRIARKQVETAQMQIDMVLWDIHGEDQFQQVQMSYLRGASAYILVVDGLRKASLVAALDLQKRVTQRIGDVPCVMVINKCDLQADWEVMEDDIAMLKAQNYDLIRTSTKTRVGIDSCFSKLIEKLTVATQ
ncbi:MAG: Rab family GTPase [Cyanobacteria bacterium P01_D01_bin.1]